jgi:Tfp pilus assembly protein PilN
MLRTNLSTRPFYNERAVHAVAALIAIAVLAVTAWQVVRVVRLSRYKTELNTAIRRDRNETQKDTVEAQQIRRGIDQKQLADIAAAAREANDLIAQRTFSWTELFNQIEQTLPDDVMLTGVHPEIKDGVTQVHLDVQARGEDVINEFWDRLEKTGKFHNPEWTAVTISPDGNHQMTMAVVYTASRAAARPAAVKQ